MSIKHTSTPSVLFSCSEMGKAENKSDLESLLSDINHLRIEVNCRIEHGAGEGHLEYVQDCLDQIMDAHRVKKP